MSKIKLCLITPAHWSAFMGGAQYQAKCILDELLPTGRYDVSYLANMIDPDFHPSNYRIRPIGDSVSRLGYMTHARQLYRELNQIKPDVIYQRVACGYTGVAAWYAKRNGVRMIWHIAHDGDVAPGRLEYGRNPLRNMLELRSVEYAIRHATIIVTQTKYQADLLAANYRRHADAIIPNFQPLPDENADKSGPITVVWVANLKRWKQPEAFVRLAAAHRDRPDIRFVMVGAPPQGSNDAAWFQDLLRTIRMSPNIEYLGQQSQQNVNRILSRAHIFVNTSLHEGFANTFIQAWMRKVPVVSLHVNPDGVFDREEVGVCAGTESRMQKMVAALADDARMREAQGQQAYTYALANHSVLNVRTLETLISGGRSCNPGDASNGEHEVAIRENTLD